MRFYVLICLSISRLFHFGCGMTICERWMLLNDVAQTPPVRRRKKNNPASARQALRSRLYLSTSLLLKVSSGSSCVAVALAAGAISKGASIVAEGGLDRLCWIFLDIYHALKTTIRPSVLLRLCFIYDTPVWKAVQQAVCSEQQTSKYKGRGRETQKGSEREHCRQMPGLATCQD